MTLQQRQLAADGATRFARAVAVFLSLGCAALASMLLAEAAARDGFSGWDGIRALLVFATTAWLAWGASLALIGLFGGRSTPPRPALDAPQRQEPTAKRGSPRRWCGTGWGGAAQLRQQVLVEESATSES